MSYLVDTNIVSELVKNTPDKNVLDWFKQTPDLELYLSVLTLGEIRRGVDKIRDESKKQRIKIWLDHELLNWFGDRILNVDIEVANKWGIIQCTSTRTLPAVDSLIAATALHHGLIVVTRNTKDFILPGLEVINPFN